jgi:hypothetical protein
MCSYAIGVAKCLKEIAREITDSGDGHQNIEHVCQKAPSERFFFSDLIHCVYCNKLYVLLLRTTDKKNGCHHYKAEKQTF